MALPIMSTTPVTGKQACELMDSMDKKIGYNQDVLDFKVDMEVFKERLKLAQLKENMKTVVERLKLEQHPIPPHLAKIINDHFWDLI